MNIEIKEIKNTIFDILNNKHIINNLDSNNKLSLDSFFENKKIKVLINNNIWIKNFIINELNINKEYYVDNFVRTIQYIRFNKNNRIKLNMKDLNVDKVLKEFLQVKKESNLEYDEKIIYKIYNEKDFKVIIFRKEKLLNDFKFYLSSLQSN